MPKISVIVPVYGVEDYIERCAHSLFGQTLDDIEYIFVNDCTPDKSIDILLDVLHKYPNRKHQVKIIHREHNGGQAAARTSGMKAATGEYMIHCDPDDWIEPFGYKTMYETAIHNDADMVIAPHYRERNGTVTIWGEGVNFKGTGVEAILQMKYGYGLCDKLLRTSIIKNNNIYPFTGINYGEDLNVLYRVLCHTKLLIWIATPFYHYFIRETSICQYSRKIVLLKKYGIQNFKKIDKFLDEYGKQTNNPHISCNLTLVHKFWDKWPLYVEGEFEDWYTIWPEATKNVLKIRTIDFRLRWFIHLFGRYPKFLRLVYYIKK